MGEIVDIRPFARARSRRRVLARLGVALALGGTALAACANLRFATTGVARDAAVVLSAPASPPSVLVVIGNVEGVHRLVGETIRPSETVAVLGSDARVVAAGTAPGPVSVVLPGRPRPGPSGTTFLRAENRRALASWNQALTAARAGLAGREATSLAGFVDQLRLPVNLEGNVSLAAAIELARRAETSLATVGEDGGHRVILIGSADLATTGLGANTLDGDTVIVEDPNLPSPAVIEGTEAALYGAGAAWAVVVDPVSADALAHLVTTGLATTALSETFAANVSFANDSASLTPAARMALGHLVQSLGANPVEVVVNAYASSTGTPGANLVLSERRGEQVAAFLAASGVDPATIAVFAHGATDFIAPGPSPANRRVSVVVRSVDLPSA